MKEFDPHSLDASSDNGSATVIQIDNGKAVTAVAVCAALCGISVAISFNLASKLEQRENDIHAMQRTEYNSVLTRVQLLDNHVTKLANEVEKENERR